MRKSLVVIALIALQNLGCGPDRELLMETKFDAPLRQEISAIGEEDPPRMLNIIGRCDSVVDASMRQDLINAGAEVQHMEGNVFRAIVSSKDVFNVAALNFVTQVRLSQELKNPSK